jgi:outer membrane immunogenic protein
MGLAVDDTMVYFTGGPAIGGVHNSLTFTSPSDPNKSSTKTRVGWAVGSGIETMWDQHWTIGLEALFVDLGRYGNSAYTGNCGGGTCPTSFSNQALIGRFKINYRF